MSRKYLELIDQNNKETFIAIDSITAIITSSTKTGSQIYCGTQMFEVKKTYLQIIKQLTDIKELELVKFD